MKYQEISSFLFEQEIQNAKASIFCGDCFLVLEQLVEKNPAGFVDMIFVDPPYFLSSGGITCHSGKMVSVDKGSWDKSKSIEEMHQFNMQWLALCQKALKANGTIWVSGTSHVIHSVGYAMQTLGYKILNDITWEKPNPPPNLSCRYFTHATETIIWAAKNSKSKHKFNYQEMKVSNAGKQMKSVWKITAPNSEEKIFGKHPTQKPLKLLERCILAASDEADLILDPFMGSGTTAVAALQHGRNVIGIELDQEYCELTKKRINKFFEQPKLAIEIERSM